MKGRQLICVIVGLFSMSYNIGLFSISYIISLFSFTYYITLLVDLGLLFWFILPTKAAVDATLLSLLETICTWGGEGNRHGTGGHRLHYDQPPSFENPQ